MVEILLFQKINHLLMESCFKDVLAVQYNKTDSKSYLDMVGQAEQPPVYPG